MEINTDQGWVIAGEIRLATALLLFVDVSGPDTQFSALELSKSCAVEQFVVKRVASGWLSAFIFVFQSNLNKYKRY